jgi:hypothetical protein
MMLFISIILKLMKFTTPALVASKAFGLLQPEADAA